MAQLHDAILYATLYVVFAYHANPIFFISHTISIILGLKQLINYHQKRSL